MKKLLFLICVCCLLAPSRATETITVPVTVQAGDTLYSICNELKAEYGDDRDVREIIYYAQKDNNVYSYLQVGEVINIKVVVVEK